MATRLYLSSTTQTTVNRAVDTAQFSQNFSAFNHYWMETTANTAFSTKSEIMNDATNPDNWAMAAWYSHPMSSVHSDWGNGTTTVTFVIRMAESAANMNAFYKVGIYIVNNTATSIVSDAFFTGGIELNVTTLQSRRLSLATNAMDAVTNSVGDRLMFVVGCNKQSTRTGDTFSMEIGGNAATDLTDGNTDVDQDNPWFEVSQNVTFDSEAAASTNTNQLMMVGCGT